MATRKTKGIVSMITGAIGIGVGVVLFTTTNTPDWVPIVVQAISMIAGLLGFKLTIPEDE